MQRPEWDETWMQFATIMAERSICSRAKVGAVIVSTAQRVLATGYNGPPATYPRIGCGSEVDLAFCIRGKYGPTPETVKSYEDCPMIHAEMNALMHSDRTSREGGTLYVTGPCCWTCAKAVANSGLARVVVREEQTDRTYRGIAETLDLFDVCGIQVGYVK